MFALLAKRLIIYVNKLKQKRLPFLRQPLFTLDLMLHLKNLENKPVCCYSFLGLIIVVPFTV